MKIVSIIGAAKAGKTAVIERLVSGLKRRGHRVGVIKHAGEDFAIDRKGTDSERIKSAGAAVSCVSAGGKWAAVADSGGDTDPEILASMLMRGCDIIILEGYKKHSFPKIEIFRQAVSKKLVATEKGGLIAVVSDDAVKTGVPVFKFRHAKELAGFVEERFLNEPATVELYLGGQKIPMNRFVREFLSGAVLGMTGALRGGGKGKTGEVELRIRAASFGKAKNESGGREKRAGKSGRKP